MPRRAADRKPHSASASHVLISSAIGSWYQIIHKYQRKNIKSQYTNLLGPAQAAVILVSPGSLYTTGQREGTE